MSGNLQTNEIFESEEAFHTLFEHSPDAIILVDPKGSGMGLPIKLCNEAAWRMHGYESKEDLLQQPLSVLWAGGQDLRRTLTNAHEKGSITSDVLHLRRDGSFFPVNYFYVPVHIKGIEFLMLVVRDVTSIRQLEEMFEKAQKSEERFQAIFDTSPNGIVIIDPTKGLDYWPIEDCNESFLEMNGYTDRTELIGKDIEKVNIDPQPRDEYYQRLKRERSISVVVTHKRRDGTTFPIL